MERNRILTEGDAQIWPSKATSQLEKIKSPRRFRCQNGEPFGNACAVGRKPPGESANIIGRSTYGFCSTSHAFAFLNAAIRLASLSNPSWKWLYHGIS